LRKFSTEENIKKAREGRSVADPDVFGPPKSESINSRYISGSGSFYHQPKIVRKILIPIVL
jgi:hypothetical protein